MTGVGVMPPHVFAIGKLCIYTYVHVCVNVLEMGKFSSVVLFDLRICRLFIFRVVIHYLTFLFFTVKFLLCVFNLRQYRLPSKFFLTMKIF